MKYIFFTFLLFVSFRCVCQYSFCDTLSSNTDYTNLNRPETNTLKKYIINKYPKLALYQANRFDLKPIHVLHNMDDVMLLSDEKKVAVDIKFKSFSIDGSTFFIKPSVPNRQGGQLAGAVHPTFGIHPLDTLVQKIESISVNGVQLPIAAFDDLINVNRFVTDISVKPIEVYPSADGKYLFIYIWGETKRSRLVALEPYVFSYMCKIVVTLEGDYIGRIVERGDVLRHFGFGRCPLFIGF